MLQNQSPQFMADRSSRRRSPLVPTPESESFSSPVHPAAGSKHRSERPAAFVRSSSSAEDATFEPQLGDKRKHSEACEEDSAHSGASGQTLQVADSPLKGAFAVGLALYCIPMTAMCCGPVLGGAVRIPPAKLEGERTCRPTHASATCAYPRDQNHELSMPWPLVQAEGSTSARSSGDVHPRRCA